MPAPPKHDQAECPGTLIRVYERPGRTIPLRPLGYVCDVCRSFLPDEDLEMQSINELRPAVEAVKNEVVGLLWDRRVEERAAGIVRANPELLASAQRGNPYLNGVRRWYALATALVLRRHIDPGSRLSLRWVVEQLTALEEAGAVTTAGSFKSDLERLHALSTRFRPYLNALVHGGGAPSAGDAPVTFNDLSNALDVVRDVGQRAYSAIANVSFIFEPVEQFEWTEIFQTPWIRPDVDNAYELGAPGIPFDALSLSKGESKAAARLDLEFKRGKGSNELVVTASNDTDVDALDVRIFAPHLSTVIDVPEIEAGQKVGTRLSWQNDGDPKFGYGQAVLEFSDVHDNVYRQYADVDICSARVRKLSPIPFRVQGRIVAARQGLAEVR